MQSKTKFVAFVAILILLAATGFTEEKGGDHHDRGYKSEIDEIMNRYEDTEIGSLTFGELEKMMAELSVPHQKASYVRKSAMASYMIPGLGQFKNGATGLGMVFLLGELVVTAGTLVGTYFVLPDAVTQLDYLGDSASVIEAAWKSLSLRDMAPAIGIMAAGGIVDMILRGISSRNASHLAKARIESGEKTFSPRIGFVMEDGLSIAFGMHR